MRKLNYLVFLFVVAISFTSCDKDDDDSSVASADLVGKWRYTAQTVNGESVELEECQSMNTIEFFSDGKYNSETFVAEQSTDANGQTTTTCESSSIENATWEIVGDILKLSSDSEEAIIDELNETNLKLKLDASFDVGGETVDLIIITTFTRVN